MKVEKSKLYSIVISIFIVGIFLRFFQINLESYWLDEMVSFWIADPKISFEQTIIRNSYISQSPPLFDLILKYFFLIFNYDPYTGRYLNFIFGIISIPLLTILSLNIKKNYSFLLTLFLVCTNIYLIKYSQETRPYILVFSLSILNIIIYFKLNDLIGDRTKKSLLTLSFIIISICNYSAHPFTLIILYSQIFHSLYLKIVYGKNLKLFLFSLFVIIIFYLAINYNYLLEQLSYKEYFLEQENWKFFYNYYFSRFFGSKIMGLIYLITLIFLIYKFKKKIFLHEEKYLFLFILLIFSYIIPLFYGFIKTPVLTDRYIIFVLIPIFLLISNLIFEIKDKKLKIILISFLLIPTIINNFIEIKHRKIAKPEFDLFFEEIKDKNVNNFKVLGNDKIVILIENYIKNLSNFKINEYQFIYKKEELTNNSLIWIVCYEPINNFNCNDIDFDNNSIMLLKKKYFLLSSRLYKFEIK